MTGGDSMHMLEGILKGVAIDGLINEKEFRALGTWLFEHAESAGRPPFDKIVPVLQLAALKGRLDPEALLGLISICAQARTRDHPSSAIAADLQRLRGILAGILADRDVT